MKFSVNKIAKSIWVFVLLVIQQGIIAIMTRNVFDEYVSSRLKRIQMNVRSQLPIELIEEQIYNPEIGQCLPLENQLTITKNQIKSSFEVQITDIYIQYTTSTSIGWSILSSTNYSTPYQSISSYLNNQVNHVQTVFQYDEPITNLNKEDVIQLVLPVKTSLDEYKLQLGISILYSDFISKSNDVQFSFYLFLIMGIIIITELYFVIIFKITNKNITNQNINQLLIAKEAMFDSWWEVDRSIKLVNASNNFYQMLGYTKEEANGKYFQEFLTPEENTRVNGGLRLLLTQNQPIRHFRNRRETKDGEIRTYLTTGFPKIDDKGRVIGFYCYDYDITNIENIKNKSILFREQYFQYPQPMIITNVDLCIKYVNKQFTERFNIRQNSVQNKFISDFIKNLPPDSIKSRIKDHILSKNYLIEDIEWIDQYGNIHNLQQYISSIKNAQGEIINYFFIFRDMDYSDAIEKESNNIEDIIRQLIIDSNVPIILIDQETKKILLSNGKLQDFLGYDIEQIKNMFLYDIYDLTIEEVNTWVDDLIIKTHKEDTVNIITKNRSKNYVKFIQKIVPLFDRKCAILIVNKEEK